MRFAPFFMAFAIAGGAFADNEGAADMGAARALGTEGLRLAEAGNCAAAIDKLARAEKIHHAPTTLVRLGECEVSTGHLVDGTEHLRRAAREALPSNAPPVFVSAQARAREALDKASPRVPNLRVDVTGASPSDVTMKIDGAPVSSALVGVDRPIDPGAHVVEISAPGYKASTQRFSSVEGKSEAITINLERATEVSVDVHRKTPDVLVTPPATRRNLVPSFIAFGTAGVAFVVGSIFGGVAIAKKNDLVAACGGSTSCPPSEHGAFTDLDAFANVSTIAFVTAGVAAAAGVVLFIVAPKRNVERVAFTFGPRGAILRGSF